MIALVPLAGLSPAGATAPSEDVTPPATADAGVQPIVDLQVPVVKPTHSVGYAHWRQVVRRRYLRRRVRVRRVRRLVRVALQQRGIPYVWGGTSRGGFDCSGLVQYVYRRIGIYLPRTTWSQMRYGRHVSRAGLRTGDVVFTHSGGHEGIYLGSGYWINSPHSGSVVRVQRLSYYGSITAARRYF
jgi:cell wall-associated NlpC family hydrolase